MTIHQFITIIIKLLIGYFVITEIQGRDLKGRLQQRTDYESVWSPESFNTKTASEPPTDYENANVNQMVASNYENLPPLNSGTYESVKLPDSSHIYDALSKEGIYK